MKPDTARVLLASSAALLGITWSLAPVAIMRIKAVLDQAAVAVAGDIRGVVDGISRAVPVLQAILLVSVAAVALFLIASISGGLRTSWTRRIGFAASLTSLAAFPLGTILGIWGLAHLIRRRHEFGSGKTASTPGPAPEPG